MHPTESPVPSGEKLPSPEEPADATAADEEERGPFMFSPSQVRNAKIIWPDVDLIDEPAPNADQEQPET